MMEGRFDPELLEFIKSHANNWSLQDVPKHLEHWFLKESTTKEGRKEELWIDLKSALEG